MNLPYGDISFPPPPESRPYVFINMVSTIDGKILTGERDEHVMDLGSKNDHAVMRHLESMADGVIIGAGSLRATKGLWYSKDLIRIVVSASGNLPWESRFFTDAPEKAFVATLAPGHIAYSTAPLLPNPGGAGDGMCPGVRLLSLDLSEALTALRQDHGVRYLLCEGGAELNASLLRLDLVDELFLTLAPKIKLGRDVPTYAGGEPLTREEVQQYALVEVHRVDDEVFLRYRRR
jgi:riboflavin biosynthesis pyrimidine reductase